LRFTLCFSLNYSAIQNFTNEAEEATLMETNTIKAGRMLTEERRREIAGLLEQQGRVTVDEVRRRFGVSAVTARGDLDALSANGLLVRSHGGGIRPLESGPDYPLKIRETIRHEQKLRIAKAAVELIKPSQTIILCTGSTSVELANQIRRSSIENISVITYALNIAALLADAPNLSLIMIGGILRQVSNAFVGPQAEQMMSTLHADHLFLSAVGLDPEIGPTTIDILEAQLNSRMVRAARQVTVIADSSKLGQRSLAAIAGISQIHRLITDTGAPEATVERLRESGVEVVLA
jgi:DeoR family transcriptional regulator, aga operon transcriptional repressor